MVSIEAVESVFEEENVDSPYMSFAPTLKRDAQARMGAITHYDGTSRPQTVTSTQEPWVHALLTAYGERAGDAVLINTSFNTHGDPLINSAEEALALLMNEADLDYVVIEDWLFKKKS